MLQTECEKVGKRIEELVKEVTDKQAIRKKETVSGKGDLQQLFKSAEVSKEPPQENVDTGRNLLRLLSQQNTEQPAASSKQSQEKPSGSVQDFSVAVVSSEAGQAQAAPAPVPHPGLSMAGISPVDDDTEEGGGGADAASAKTPVSLLNNLYMRQGLTPKYELVQTGLGIGDFIYRVTIGELEAMGCGQSKRKAKHSAAKSILEKIKELEQLCTCSRRSFLRKMSIPRAINHLHWGFHFHVDFFWSCVFRVS